VARRWGCFFGSTWRRQSVRVALVSPVFDVERVGRLRRWRGPDWPVSGPGTLSALSVAFCFGLRLLRSQGRVPVSDSDELDKMFELSRFQPIRLRRADLFARARSEHCVGTSWASSRLGRCRSSHPSEAWLAPFLRSGLRPTRTYLTLNTRCLGWVEFKVIETSLNSWPDGWAEFKVDHAA
jgi:hypothetical protein